MATPKTFREALGVVQNLGQNQKEIVDLISELQNGRIDIDLPQIIVVGGQNAGKSTLLRAITGVVFPTSAKFLTRYATEIRLRKTPNENFQAFILPESEFEGPRDLNFSIEDEMEAVFNEANTKIPGQSVSRDKLVVEISGPTVSAHLTLVDLPGLFTNQTGENQGEEDKAKTRDLTVEYMKNKRSIILAVVAGNIIDHTKIMDHVRRIDPDGERTIGVITKPDAAADAAAEDLVIELARNKMKNNQLRLGWHVILNPKPKSNQAQWTPSEREAQERSFFQQEPWSHLDPAQTSLQALCGKLSEQLELHIRHHVPAMRDQVQEKLNGVEQQLDDMGEVLLDEQQRRTDFEKRLDRSCRVARDAARGYYWNDKRLFDNAPEGSGTPPVEKLRAVISLRNTLFQLKLRREGNAQGLVAYNSTLLPPDSGNSPIPTSLDSLVSGTYRATALSSSENAAAKRKYAQETVRAITEENQGVQLSGQGNPMIPYKLFNKHQARWNRIAQDHLREVDKTCRAFVARVLDAEWEPYMRPRLRENFLADKQVDLEKKAKETLADVLRSLARDVADFDWEFLARVNEWEDARRAQAAAAREGTEEADLSFLEAEKDLERSLVLYEINAKFFMRYVIIRIVEDVYMAGIEEIFYCHTKSQTFTDRFVDDIMVESKEVQEHRHRLVQQKQNYEAAINKLDAVSSLHQPLSQKDIQEIRNAEQAANRVPPRTVATTGPPSQNAAGAQQSSGVDYSCPTPLTTAARERDSRADVSAPRRAAEPPVAHRQAPPTNHSPSTPISPVYPRADAEPHEGEPFQSPSRTVAGGGNSAGRRSGGTGPQPMSSRSEGDTTHSHSRTQSSGRSSAWSPPPSSTASRPSTAGTTPIRDVGNGYHHGASTGNQQRQFDHNPDLRRVPRTSSLSSPGQGEGVGIGRNWTSNSLQSDAAGKFYQPPPGPPPEVLSPTSGGESGHRGQFSSDWNRGSMSRNQVPYSTGS